jgi:hypothetical protein
MKKAHARALCSLALIAISPLAALSWWRIIPLDEAVRDSDLIIVGTLRGVSEEAKGETDYGAGELTVDEVLRGNAEAGQRLALVWENDSAVICPRIDHQEDQGKQVIWLLKRAPGGRVTANNPGRYIAIKNKEDVITLIRQQAKSKKGE